MGESKIEWTKYTHNEWWGCVEEGPECDNCYARDLAKWLGHGGTWGNYGVRRFFGEKHSTEPHKWNRDAEAAGERRRVFCSSLADVFENRDDLDEHRERLWRVIAETPWLDWLLLTKRPENVDELVPGSWVTGAREWPANVWLGFTAEDQEHYDRRAAIACSLPAPVIFTSIEPQLERVVLRCQGCGHPIESCKASRAAPDGGGCSGLWPSWVIVGGESGRGARPFNVQWARDIVAQCRAARVAVFVKQLGAFAITQPNGKDPGPRRLPLVNPKGGDISEFPPDLRVREFPDVAQHTRPR